MGQKEGGFLYDEDIWMRHWHTGITLFINTFLMNLLPLLGYPHPKWLPIFLPNHSHPSLFYVINPVLFSFFLKNIIFFFLFLTSVLVGVCWNLFLLLGQLLTSSHDYIRSFITSSFLPQLSPLSWCWALFSFV